MSVKSEGRSDPVRGRVLRTPPLSSAQVERFLEHVGAGLTRQEAAVRVQEEWDSGAHGDELCRATASRFRRLYFADPVFAQRYDEALESDDGSDETVERRKRLNALERLRAIERAFDEYMLRALEPERGRSGSSNRALLNVLTLISPTFKPFLEARVRHVHSGAVGLYAQPTLDTSKLSIEEQRELIEIERRRMVLIEKARPQDTAMAPTELQDAAEVIDGVAVELPALGPGV
jgi:hypothetical protein